MAAHAVAPRQSYMQYWRDDLQWLADQCVDDNVIMAGDFNATIDHMSNLGVDGGTLGRCHDGAAETGNGGVGTWIGADPGAGRSADRPRDGLESLEADRLARADGRWTASGSDHRPLIVQFEPVD